MCNYILNRQTKEDFIEIPAIVLKISNFSYFRIMIELVLFLYYHIIVLKLFRVAESIGNWLLCSVRGHP